MKHPVAFLLDADNTLLDNDRILADLMGHIEQTVGHQGKRHYWAIFEELREELGYADYLGALQGYRNRFPHEPRLMSIASFILNYPFADRLYPHSLEVVQRLKQWGAVVILSDGDMVFQPRKVEQSGLLEAADDNVLIYVHKELELEDVERRYPGGPLPVGGRQAAYPDHRQGSVGRPGHHRLSPAGTLCPGPRNPGPIPSRRPQHRWGRRPADL